ncbi:MAG TPA: hypothetical protein VKV39_08555 [Candidatus Sulfotelmatobacter sp.]|nr:hypothetical protein [Candidatus Sulfotelmatobacter sp.]
MSQGPLCRADDWRHNRFTMRGVQSPWLSALPLSLALLLVLLITACSGASHAGGSSSGSGGNNSGGSGSGGGGNGGSGGSGGSGGAGGSNLACDVMATGQTASLNGFVPFSSNSLWNTDISAAPVDPNSSSIISNWVGSVNLHPDWGTDPTYGIPYIIVNGSQPLISVNLGAYPDESDPGPMPVPANAPIEGGSSSTGDRHVLVLNNANCYLYELYNASPNSDGSWNADSTAVWDLLGDEQRPYTWTSADAAGLPIFPGLVRYDEVVSGTIQHAFRFTLPRTRAAFTPPASHWAANTSDPTAPPMGMRLRLKSSYDISGFDSQMQVILTAMKKYGLILADNGSSLFVTGASDSRWGSDLDSLKTVPSSAFEVVEMNPVYTSSNYPTGAAPTISSFTASASHVSAGGSVTLSWTTSNDQYVIVAPGAGVVRGNSVVVNPSSTTTYTIYATNQYGRSTNTVTVNVP